MSELFHVRYGRGRPIVVIHGGLGLDHTYMRALDRMGDIAELIYIDVRGNGRSSHERLATATLDTFADDIDALRAALGFDRWTVLGHSYGAFIALTYAMKFPERTTALVTIGGAASFEHGPAVIENLDKREQPDAAGALREVLGQPARDDQHLADVWPRILPLYFHQWNARHANALADTIFSAAGYNRGSELLATYNIKGELARITSPTFLVVGGDDFITPADIGTAALVKGIPHTKVAIIPNAGHFPFLEQPVAFDAELRKYLT
jgi:proline iminopeptidase